LHCSSSSSSSLLDETRAGETLRETGAETADETLPVTLETLIGSRARGG
jgi:hypothetical protein